ncbi:Usher syndrome type-1G protein-like [Centruroides sculpturatus]|uniref:Usher syndrome type-1G protein-like n=1 Tax=Centruroides sculpturatus TaxID=218467 RepID=UPI000C6C9031|nr:Usher syndrome type-1G protein-like [Centruroides sculpturatus]
MAVDTERFHRAARDGYLDLLQESTRKDCNTQDEDGMTPTIWASYYGNLEALRLIVGRGGDPDKCDYYGNTSLHCAAANGHLNCVSFLVNFGVNLWALDNDFHTAKDIAAMRQHEDILKYLDDAITKQSNLNKKHVQKLKEKAIKDAEKRIKIYNKLQKKAAKKAERDEKYLEKERRKMSDDQANLGIGSSLLPIRKDSRQLYTSPRFSEIVNYSETNSKKKGFSAVSKKILQKRNIPRNEFKVREVEQNGKKSIRSLSGLKRDSEVIYIQTDRPHMKDVFDQQNNLERSISEPGYLNSEEILSQNSSIFDRPGFGSVAFRNSMYGTLLSIPPKEIQEEEEEEEDSIGSAGSLAQRNTNLPWDADQLDLDDKEELDLTSLINFLSSQGLSEYIPIFTKEKIDLDTLYILTEDDLKSLGLPFGPRKKLSKALQERKPKEEETDEVVVSYL